MRLLSKMGMGLAACALVGFMPAKAEALVLSTANDACLAPGSSYSQDLDFLAGTPAPTNGCGLNTTGFTLLFKDDGSESGSFNGSYDGSILNQNTDALIDYISGPSISCGAGSTCWAVAKDGSHNPGWYGWNLTALGWNGTDDLDFQNLFVNPDGSGAISHVSIWGIPGGSGGGGGGTGGGGGGTGGGGGGLPEPASLSLFGLGMLGTAWRARRRRVS